jgi:Mg2+-importing ATPase
MLARSCFGPGGSLSRSPPRPPSSSSWPLAVSTFAVIAIGALLPLSPIAHTLGFVAPDAALYGVIAIVVLVYLVVVDLTKTLVFDGLVTTTTRSRPNRRRRQTLRRTTRFTPHRTAPEA